MWPNIENVTVINFVHFLSNVHLPFAMTGRLLSVIMWV